MSLMKSIEQKHKGKKSEELIMYLKAKFLSILTNVSRDFRVPIKSTQLDYRLSILNNTV